MFRGGGYYKIQRGDKTNCFAQTQLPIYRMKMVKGASKGLEIEIKTPVGVFNHPPKKRRGAVPKSNVDDFFLCRLMVLIYHLVLPEEYLLVPPVHVRKKT